MKRTISLVLMLCLLSVILLGCTDNQSGNINGRYDYLGFMGPLNTVNYIEKGEHGENFYQIESLDKNTIEYNTKYKSGQGELTDDTVILMDEIGEKTVFIRHGDYLIDKGISTKIESIQGEMPEKKKKTNCTLFLNEDSFKNYSLQFFGDGKIKIYALFQSSECLYEGTYSTNGEVILLNLTYGYNEGTGMLKKIEANGSLDCAIFVKENNIYTRIYQKK